MILLQDYICCSICDREPPKKNEAFEEFKKDLGAEAHKVFLTNKGTYSIHCNSFDTYLMTT